MGAVGGCPVMQCVELDCAEGGSRGALRGVGVYGVGVPRCSNGVGVHGGGPVMHWMELGCSGGGSCDAVMRSGYGGGVGVPRCSAWGRGARGGSAMH